MSAVFILRTYDEEKNQLVTFKGKDVIEFCVRWSIS